MAKWKDPGERGDFGAWLTAQVGPDRTYDWLAAEMARGTLTRRRRLRRGESNLDVVAGDPAVQSAGCGRVIEHQRCEEAAANGARVND